MFFCSLSPIPMATIIERDVSRGDSGATMASLVIAVIVLAIVLAIALYTLRVFPFANAPSATNGAGNTPGGSVNGTVNVNY